MRPLFLENIQNNSWTYCLWQYWQPQCPISTTVFTKTSNTNFSISTKWNSCCSSV